MAERRHEPTQPGNPRQLTIAQHIHSRWCISKFADTDGCVAVLRCGHGTIFRTKPDNDIFCAKRVWDENLERGLFGKVEGPFHSVVEAVLAGGTVTDHRAVTEYVSIWQIRAQLAEQPTEDFVLNGIGGSALSRDEEEILEKKRGAFTRPGGVVPGRFGAFVHAHRSHDTAMSQLVGVRWGVLRTKDCDGFISPDRPASELYVPINRNTALVAGYRDMEVGRATVDDLNRSSHEQANRIVFGHPHDLAAFVSCVDVAGGTL